MTVYEIPLSPTPQNFSISLAGVPYRLRFYYNNFPDAGWTLDVMDANSNPLVCGIPLVTGTDLLAPYAYLNFGGSIVVLTDGTPDRVPNFDELGNTSRVYFVTRP